MYEGCCSIIISEKLPIDQNSIAQINEFNQFTAPKTGWHYIILSGLQIAGGVNDPFIPFTIDEYKIGIMEATYAPLSPTTAIAAAILPSSRSSRVPGPVTFFATIINGGNVLAAGCRLYPANGVPANFFFWQTDPATNAVIGEQNIPINIEPGKVGTFLVRWEPLTLIDASRQPFVFDCRNTDPAPETPGVNTLDFSVHRDPSPDLVMLSATATGDGVLSIPAAGDTGAFAIAMVNIGAGGSVTISPEVFSGVPVTATVCETTPSTGQCLASPTASLAKTFAANETPTFTVFVKADANIDFAPGTNRIGLQAFSGGVNVGATSVAVRTLQLR
jgi:hypothetical protein